MFRVIQLHGDHLTTHEGEAHVHPPVEGTLTWIDLSSTDEVSLQILAERFHFHPLALEDCAHQDQRPKAEEYEGHLFLVSQGFECPGGDLKRLHWHELHAFLGPNYLVTVHEEEMASVEATYKRAARDPATLKRGVDFLYYLILDRMVDENFPILDHIADALETIEDDVLTRPRDVELGHLFGLKRHLVLMRKILSPQRDMLAVLSRRATDHGVMSEKTAIYFRDVYDHLARIVESIESNRDLLGNAFDAYLSATSQRTNEIMKALALLSAVFMPLTFITGFFGQNFEHLPFGSDALMYSMIASMLVLPIALLVWFKSRRWF
jgi:magnesium transporter